MGHRAAPDPASPNRVKRLRDKYEAELSELEQSERKLQERCAELKGRLGEAEGENVRLQGLVRQKEKELVDVKAVSRWIRHLSPGPQPPPSTHTVPVVPHVPQVNEQLTGERSSLAQVLRQEFANRLATSEEENRQIKAELAELRAHQRLELEQLTREKQAELEEVHGRWAPGLTGVLGSTGLGKAGRTLWLQRGCWAKDGERLHSLLPADAECVHQPQPGAPCLRLGCPLCVMLAPGPGRKPAIPNQGRCPTYGCPERSSLALGPLGLGGVGAVQIG